MERALLVFLEVVGLQVLLIGFLGGIDFSCIQKTLRSHSQRVSTKMRNEVSFISFIFWISSFRYYDPKSLEDKGDVIEERMFLDIFQIQSYLLLHDDLYIVFFRVFGLFQ